MRRTQENSRNGMETNILNDKLYPNENRYAGECRLRNAAPSSYIEDKKAKTMS
jgi:hypothetical protein